jgi:glutaredoxin
MFPEPIYKGYSIYGATYCNYCQKAKAWCVENQKTFMYVNIYDFITKDEHDKLFNFFGDKIKDQKTIPIIFIDGQYVGGYDSLIREVKDCQKDVDVLQKNTKKLDIVDDF